MLLKIKSDSLIFKTGLFSFLIFGSAILLMVLCFIFITNKQVLKLVSEENEEHIYTTVRQLDTAIVKYIDNMAKISKSSTLLKAVMNTDDTKYYLPDYIEDLKLDTLNGNFSLLAFDGDIIISQNSDESGSNFNYFNLLDNNDRGDKGILYIKDINKFLIYGSVLYQGFTEGFIIFTVDIESIFNSNSVLFESDKGIHRTFSVRHDKDQLFISGNMPKDFITSVYPLDSLPLDVEIFTNKEVAYEPVKKILKQIIIISICLCLIISLLAGLIISKNIIKPLSILEKGILKTGSGDLKSIPRIRREPSEIRFLRKSFNSIIRALKEKADDVEYSNSELKRINDNLHKTQKQLVQSEKMASIGQLAAGVAHEINNPTGFVTTNLHTMKEYVAVFKNILGRVDQLLPLVKKSNDKELLSLIKSIELIKEEEDYDFICEDSSELLVESIDGVVRIKDIVNGLRNFAREDNPDKELASVNSAIEDALRLTWNELKYNCKVEKDLGEFDDIYCHPDQLTQVLVNLLVNAAHAMEEGGDIKIKSWEEDDKVLISVSDTGSGIAEENLDKLFDPFFTTKDVGQGTGLGLAISYGIIEEHGGEIVVETEIGKGTTFKINLPKSEC